MSKDRIKLIEFFQKQLPERCFYCGTKLVSLRIANTFHPMARFVHDRYTRDHVEPLSLGGSRKQRNIVPCCQKCNLAKGKMTLEQFRAFRFAGRPVEFYAEQLYRVSQEKAGQK